MHVAIKSMRNRCASHCPSRPSCPCGRAVRRDQVFLHVLPQARRSCDPCFLPAPLFCSHGWHRSPPLLPCIHVPELPSHRCFFLALQPWKEILPPTLPSKSSWNPQPFHWLRLSTTPVFSSFRHEDCSGHSSSRRWPWRLRHALSWPRRRSKMHVFLSWRREKVLGVVLFAVLRTVRRKTHRGGRWT